MTDETIQVDKDRDGLFVSWFWWRAWEYVESRKPSYASDPACDFSRFETTTNEGEKDDR